ARPHDGQDSSLFLRVSVIKKESCPTATPNQTDEAIRRWPRPGITSTNVHQEYGGGGIRTHGPYGRSISSRVHSTALPPLPGPATEAKGNARGWSIGGMPERQPTPRPRPGERTCPGLRGCCRRRRPGRTVRIRLAKDRRAVWRPGRS